MYVRLYACMYEYMYVREGFVREADGGGGNTIQSLFSSDLHFLGGYVDVRDR